MNRIMFRSISIICLTMVILSSLCIDFKTKSVSEDEQTVYNAVNAIKDAEKDRVLKSDSIWSYSEKNVELDQVSNTYHSIGNWDLKELKCGVWCSTSESVRNALPNMLYKWDSKEGEGVAVYNNKIVTFVGSKTNHSPALTFTAPKSGIVRIYDKDNGSIAGCKPDSVFYTLKKANEKLGVTIYKNDEKIWPQSADYEEISNLNQSIQFPDLNNISISQGDKLRIAFTPISVNWGYFEFAPQIDYLSIKNDLPSYSSVKILNDAQENGELISDSPWTYTAKHIKKDQDSGYNLPIGEWFNPVLTYGESDSVAINKLFSNKQMLSSGSNSGFSVYNDKIITYVGTGFNGLAGAITFHAPYSGTIDFSDPSLIGIQSAGKGYPFYTLHEKAKKVGVAVYQNNNKIWPIDEDYFTLKGDEWVDGKKIPGNTSMKLPDISNLTVTKGDDIRILLIPIGNDWGYMALAPKVEYSKVDDIQPQDENFPEYSSFESISEAVEKGSIEGSVWNIDGAPCYPDEDGYNTPTDDWINLSMMPGKTNDYSINKCIPNWLKFSNTTIGVSTFKNAVILSSGSSGPDFQVSLTFVAPKTGKVKLWDSTGCKFGTAGEGNPFWSLNENTKIAGLAIYKNKEKIWPLDKDYYKLQGRWDVVTKKFVNNESYTYFPELNDIQINKGDRIRITVIPVKNTWLFTQMAPSVKYTKLDNDPENPPAVDHNKNVAVYDAVDEVKKAMDQNDMNKSSWKIQAVSYTLSNNVGEAPKLQSLYNDDMPLIYKRMIFSSTQFPYNWFNVAQTSIAMTINSNDRLMIPVASLTANGGRVWPAITFTAPKTGFVHLGGNKINAGISAMSQGGPYYTLKNTLDPDEGEEIPVVIYRNSTKIWPLENNKDNVLTVKKRSIPFPDLDFQIYKDDSIRIIPQAFGWAYLSMSPIVEYKSFNDNVRPNDDSVAWDYGDKDAGKIDWEEMPEISEDNSYSDDSNFVEDSNEAEYNQEMNVDSPTKSNRVKKVTKKRFRKYKNNNGTPTLLIIIFSSVGAVVIGVAVFFFVKFYVKKKRKKIV